MMIVYPETAFEEVIEANRRRTWTINAPETGHQVEMSPTARRKRH
jgi:hypothetical protein